MGTNPIANTTLHDIDGLSYGIAKREISGARRYPKTKNRSMKPMK